MKRTLESVAALRALPRRTLSRIESDCLWTVHPPESVILGFNDTSSDVFFVVSGQVRAVVYSGTGTQVSFRDLVAGSMFGELAAIDDSPRSACIEALETSLVARMPRDVFWGLIDKEPAFRRVVLLHLVSMVRSLTRRIVEFSTLSVASRLHAELLRMGLEQSVSQGRAFIRHPPTHTDLANRISTTREAVTRELGKLRKNSVMQLEGTSWWLSIDQLYAMVRDAAGD